jgi:hypothetical protein
LRGACTYHVSLIGSVLGLLGSGAAAVYRLLTLILASASADSALLDLSHAAAIALVAAGLALYQWRIVRADTGSSAAQDAHVSSHIVVELSAPTPDALDVALDLLGDRGIAVKRIPA